MRLSDDDLAALRSRRDFSGEYLWNLDEEKAVDDYYRRVCADLEDVLWAKSRIESGSYGSGYASYIDAWFFRDDADFKTGQGNNFRGLVVVLSRLAPCYAFGEGHKSGTRTGGSSYLPHLSMIDHFEPPVARLAAAAEPVLDSYGLHRMFKDDLAGLLPSDWKVPTILSDPPYTVFDALFHWED